MNIKKIFCLFLMVFSFFMLVSCEKTDNGSSNENNNNGNNSENTNDNDETNTNTITYEITFNIDTDKIVKKGI